jgi:hypothetical protein
VVLVELHPDPTPRPAARRSRWLIAGVIVAALLIAGAIGVVVAVPFTSERARIAVIEQLSAQIDGDVELRELSLRGLPGLRAEGAGLVVRHKGRRDVPPLIRVERFVAEGSVLALLRRRLDRLIVEGLDIQIPPDRNRNVAERASSDSTPAPATGQAARARERAAEDPPGGDDRDRGAAPPRSFVIGQMVSTNARLIILRRDQTKDPHVWAIHTLRMEELAIDRAIPFEAELTNAVPPGQIDVAGRFGPWDTNEPGFTPLEGSFTFDDADLSVFDGIAGLLSARGSFGGMLQRIEVRGRTETPDFSVSSSGLPVPLRTEYHAIVDGTNGDTFLEEVGATFLKTSLAARGAVAHTPDRRKGRTITLDITMADGRLEDVLRLAIKSSKPPMIGALKLETSFVLPPGDLDVVKKLRLDGRFDIRAARFTDAGVQKKINELSRRGRGRIAEETAPERIASDFSGAFRLGDGQLTIPEVVFDVPGAAVQLTGNYGLESEAIDFEGWLYLDAKVSQTTTGFKSLLLRMVDPLFTRRGGGSAVPIRISGSRTDPSFGLDKGRIFKKG